MHADTDQRNQWQHRNEEHRVEVRRAHRDLAKIEGIHDERPKRAQEDQTRSRDEERVIEQQERFARHRRKATVRLQARRPDRIERQRAHDKEQQQPQHKQPARRVGCERMHRHQHARAHKERAEQTQAEGKDGEQQGPVTEQAPLLGDRQGMDQRGGRQPRHERGILHRIPEPPAAPPQFVVRPPATQGDPEREAHPSGDRPRTRPARPGGIHASR